MCQCLKCSESLDDIRYISDDEFEQMLHVQHQLKPHRSKRSVTLDYGSGILTGKVWHICMLKLVGACYPRYGHRIDNDGYIGLD